MPPPVPDMTTPSRAGLAAHAILPQPSFLVVTHEIAPGCMGGKITRNAYMTCKT